MFLRNSATLIDSIMAVTPPSEESFLLGLKDLFSSACYCPPEAEHMIWARLHSLLVSHLPSEADFEALLISDPNSWQVQVSRIVNPTMRDAACDPTRK